MLFLYLRLSPGRDHAVASWATIALSAVWAVVALILIAVPCNPSHFWPQGSERCSDIVCRLDVNTIQSLIAAVYKMASHWRLGHHHRSFHLLHLSLSGSGSEHENEIQGHGCNSILVKITVRAAPLPPFEQPSSLAILICISVIAASAVRLYYLRAMLSSPNRNLDATYYVVCTQWHLGYAIMSSTITGLGPFLRPFSKSFSTSYRRSSLSHNPSFPSSSLNDGSSGSKFQRVESFQMDALHARKTSILSLNGREKSVVSSGYLNIGGRSSIPNILDPAIPSSPNRLNLRPDNVLRRDTAVEGGVDVDEDDALSSVSNESRKMIITKRTELKVETDRASAISAREWREGSAAV